MTNAPFYAAGLKFSCKRCSSCCRYDSGYVFLSEKDLKKLADSLNMDKDRFVRTYCRWVTGMQEAESLSLKEKSNKDCVFWDSGCSVYSFRPLQCSSFPFWPSILSSSESWKIAATACPGMNTGELHSQKAIEKCVKLRGTEPVITKDSWKCMSSLGQGV
jgi:Fe-S-cluster containining protein